MERLAFLEQLNRRGVFFYLAGLGGMRDIDAEGIVAFLRNPTKYNADMHGVTEKEYRSYASANGGIDWRCPATTKRGKQCKNIREICGSFSAKEWLEHKDACCRVHRDLIK